MKFLYKLYDTEYFGIILFAIIAILILLFLIILFFGKKDEKKRIEETQKLDLDKNTFTDEQPKEDLSIPEVAQPVLEENLDNIFKDDAEEVVYDSKLADQIKEDMQKAVDSIKNASAPVEETVPVVEDVFEEAKTENIFNSDNDAFEDIKFEDEVEEQPKEEKPSFELPKMAEMPKLKDDNEQIVDSKEETVHEEKEEVKKEETVSDFDKLFGEIESETYNIDK